METFDARSMRSNDVASEYSSWKDEDENGGSQTETRERGRDETRPSRERARARARMDAEKLRRVEREGSISSGREFEAEDEAIEMTRAELDKLRDRIDKARSDAGYSSTSLSRTGSRGSSRHSSRRSSRRSSRHSSRHSSRRSVGDASDSASEFNEVAEGLMGTDAFNSAMASLMGETQTSVWTEEELAVDDEDKKRASTGAKAGSALVPQKVIDKYEQARKDYEAALKAKKDKKAALRHAKEGEAEPATPTAASVNDLAQQFNWALAGGVGRTTRKQLDYKVQYANKKAQRLITAKKPEKVTILGSINNFMFGCCMGRGKK